MKPGQPTILGNSQRHHQGQSVTIRFPFAMNLRDAMLSLMFCIGCIYAMNPPHQGPPNQGPPHQGYILYKPKDNTAQKIKQSIKSLKSPSWSYYTTYDREYMTQRDYLHHHWTSFEENYEGATPKYESIRKMLVELHDQTENYFTPYQVVKEIFRLWIRGPSLEPNPVDMTSPQKGGEMKKRKRFRKEMKKIYEQVDPSLNFMSCDHFMRETDASMVAVNALQIECLVEQNQVSKIINFATPESAPSKWQRQIELHPKLEDHRLPELLLSRFQMDDILAALEYIFRTFEDSESKHVLVLSLDDPASVYPEYIALMYAAIVETFSQDYNTHSGWECDQTNEKLSQAINVLLGLSSNTSDRKDEPQVEELDSMDIMDKENREIIDLK